MFLTLYFQLLGMTDFAASLLMALLLGSTAGDPNLWTPELIDSVSVAILWEPRMTRESPDLLTPSYPPPSICLTLKREQLCLALADLVAD